MQGPRNRTGQAAELKPHDDPNTPGPRGMDHAMQEPHCMTSSRTGQGQDGKPTPRKFDVNARNFFPYRYIGRYPRN